MTPTEKAIELVEKYNPLVKDWDCYYDTMLPEDVIMNDCKQCALIVVDELINVLGDIRNGEKWQYWINVKEEINKL